MDKFIGTINGVQYTNREDFYKALKKLKQNDIKQISYSEQTVETPVENEVETPTQEEFKQAIDLFGAIFSSFLGALVGHNALKPQPSNENDNSNLIEKQPNTAVEHSQVDFESIANEYIFGETTYEFTGDERDELELDKFDQFLQKKLQTLKNIDFIGPYETELVELREKFAADFKRVSDCRNDIDKKLHALDEKLAKTEQLINLTRDLEMPYSEYEAMYKNQQVDFDITENRGNYYGILQQYYRDVVSFIDSLF